MTNSNNTIVYFHTGRGGRFYSAGHVTFNGTKTISEVLLMNDSSKNHTFLNKENYLEIYKMLEKRNLDNLLELLESNPSRFVKLTGLKLGEDIYTDSNGNEVITAAQLNTGVGTLDWDGGYDTDTCKLLSDCSESELKLIAAESELLVQEYFDNTDLKVDWKKFNGMYANLIDVHFNDIPVDISEFYETN